MMATDRSILADCAIRKSATAASGIAAAGSMHQVLPPNVYRVDPSGKVEVVLPFEAG